MDPLGSQKAEYCILFCDDQTSSVLGCYGHPIAKTPNIDRLAREGTLFENAFVSQSICWVSRTTILTGLTGRSYGVPGNHDRQNLKRWKNYMWIICGMRATALDLLENGTLKCPKVGKLRIILMNFIPLEETRSTKNRRTDLCVTRLN